MSNEQTDLGFDFETVSTFSRQDALKTGRHIYVSQLFPKIKELFPVPIPVYFTSGVWDICKNHPDQENIVWDICYDTLFHAQQDSEGSLIIFDFSVLGSEHKILATVGINDLDDPSPAVTIMLPIEK